MAAREVPAAPARAERRVLWRARDPEGPAAPEPDGRLEAAADRFAERYESLAHGSVRPMPRLDPAASPTGGAGAPLDSATRAAMEPRLGWDLSQVRVHTGRGAADSAAALGAQAYTVGRHIVLGDGVRPGSGAGQRLLAHELAHVAQQARGEGLGRLHMKRLPPAGTRPPKPKGRGKGQPFWVDVTQELNPAELLRAFVSQYYQSKDEAETSRRLPLWHWSRPGGLSATATDVRNGGLWLNVTDVTQTALDRLPQAERDQINAEADQRFWEQNGLPPDTKLGTGPEDAHLRARWLGVRADVAGEHELLREIHALPEDVKAVLFAGQKPLVPGDYEDVLRLGRRLNALTPAQRAVYRDKITGTTTDWKELDAAITRFEAQQRGRELDAEATEAAAATLFGCEDLYRLWKRRNATRLESARTAAYYAYVPGPARAAAEASAEFDAALVRHGFADESAFLRAVENYRVRFRDEAVNIALDVLDHYDHLLYVERGKLRSPGYVAGLVSRIAESGAAGLYKRSSEAEEMASLTRSSADPESRYEKSRAASKASEYQREAAGLRSSAETAVITAGGDDPLVDPGKLGRDTSREKLARLDEAGARQYLLEVIDARLADTAKARHEFTTDPERVFSLDGLVQATKQSQGADAGTVYGEIVDDHVKAVRDAHVFTAVVLTIIALVLAVLVPVGGWVAAAALVGNTVLSVYQAMEAVQEYRKQAVEYRLSFIADSPSLAWVVVAVAAAALDLGTTTAELLKLSAKGLTRLEGPLREFAAAADAEGAAARLEKLAAKIDEAEGLDQGIKEALKTHAAAKAGLEQVLGKVMGRPMAFAGAVDPVLIMRGLFHFVRKGVSTLTKLRKEKQLLDLMGDVTKLTGAGKAELEAAFKEVQEIVKVGKARRMDDDTMLVFVDRAAAARKVGAASEFESIVADMRGWHPPTPEQIAAEKAYIEAWEQLQSLRKLKAQAQADLKAGPRTPTGATDHERIKELKEELEGLDDVVHADRDGRTWTEPGLIPQAKRDFLAAEALAEAARVSPVKRMRAVFNSSAERAEIAGAHAVDQVGTLRKASGGLEVDHVVSLDRMSQMEGFNKLKALERQQLAVRKDNLVLMDASANSSKGPRSWSAWENASNYYTDPADITKWMAKDAELTATIQKWILNTVRGR
ncbi:DUF4157 domain-containing protein [Streptomyces sp. NPDC051183]|uniref:eCIS core domain-containing protein n=1 Tax=Streptomyces sp. NPDC051183 TaxID=3155165 RepID=UPI00343CAB9F